jgi:hypothetical protein
MSARTPGSDCPGADTPAGNAQSPQSDRDPFGSAQALLVRRNPGSTIKIFGTKAISLNSAVDENCFPYTYEKSATNRKIFS